MADNFRLQFTPTGVNLFLTASEGKPFSPDDFMTLEEGERKEFEERRGRLFQRVQETLEGLTKLEKEANDRLRELAGPRATSNCPSC